MTRPTRLSRAIDVLVDIWGQSWLIAELRPTSHGFAIALGWPEDQEGPGGMRVAMTAELASYLELVDRPQDIVLPLGRTAIKRLRATLDMHFDWDTWWAARTDDLRTLTLEDFSRRHRCSVGAASQRRAALLQAA